MSHIVALSGGKDSTAMALWLAENIHRDDFDGVAVDAISHPLQDSGLVAIRQNVNQGGYADVREHAPGTMNQEQFVNPKPLRGMRLVGGIELGDVLTEDVADGLFVNANIGGDFTEGPFQRTPFDVLHQSPGHVAFLIHVADGLMEGLAAFQAFVPLAFDHDSDSLALHGSVHEPLFLEAVTLQGRVNNSAPDTDCGGNAVLSRAKQINVAFTDGNGVPPFKVQKIGQVNTVTTSDFTVPVMEGLYGYC